MGVPRQRTEEPADLRPDAAEGGDPGEGRGVYDGIPAPEGGGPPVEFLSKAAALGQAPGAFRGEGETAFRGEQHTAGPATRADGDRSWRDDLDGGDSRRGGQDGGDAGWPQRVVVGGVAVDPLTERQVVERVASEMAAGRGGHIITPNVDICRTVAKDQALRRLVREAEVVVADGMPLVWASRLSGASVPERVTGADLIWSLSKMAARQGFSIYLLGGPPGVAKQAGEELASCHPRLDVCGFDAPPYDFDVTAQGRARVRERVVAARPRLVFVGLGFPKQDLLIEELRPELPQAWFVGCGSAIAFAAGTIHRAPEWMREAGLEWLYRLLSEPARLARRYLVDDLPFAARLLGGCLVGYVRDRVAR